jgi:type IV fimbrial biogenesis protein FimT
MRKNTRSFGHGFTLIEISISIAVLGILLAIALPVWNTLAPAFQLNSATRQVVADLQLARNRAMAQYRKFRIVFNSATTYSVERQDNPGVEAYTLFSGPRSLPSGITVASNSTPVFQSRGNASPGATVTLTNSVGASRAITVLLTGRVDIP